MPHRINAPELNEMLELRYFRKCNNYKVDLSFGKSDNYNSSNNIKSYANIKNLPYNNHLLVDKIKN